MHQVSVGIFEDGLLIVDQQGSHSGHSANSGFSLQNSGIVYEILRFRVILGFLPLFCGCVRLSARGL